MTDFRAGDKALVEATVTYPHSSGAWLDLRLSDGTLVTVGAELVHPAPYADPELSPGTVVASTDPADDRQWWVVQDAISVLWFVGADGTWLERGDLDCPQLRVIFPQVTS